jgi:hypothetical protein
MKEDHPLYKENDPAWTTDPYHRVRAYYPQTKRWNDNFHFHVSDLTELPYTYTNYKGEEKTMIHTVCPACKDHVQGETSEVYDCKNLFYVFNEKGQLDIVTQCNCWSEAHGRRKD